jgi:hypothetical protein
MRQGIRLVVLTCIAVATLTSAGALGQESGGLATIEGITYDRNVNKPGLAVNWTTGFVTDPNVRYQRVVFREPVTIIELVPGVIESGGSGGGVYDMDLTGHGISTGVLGRGGDQGTIERTIANYSRACPPGCTTVAQYWCDGNYVRRGLILSVSLNCVAARFYVGTPPFHDPHLEATFVLAPSGVKAFPFPPKVDYSGAGVFTAA